SYSILSVFTFILFLGFAMLAGAEQISIRAARILDGRGNVIKNSTVVIENGRIVKIDASIKKPTLDLGDRTLLPGGIDTHTHISWHFDDNGKSHDPETPDENEHSRAYVLENAYRTLMGGITTVQSLGSPADKDLQQWIERGVIPGPRVLTSISPVTDETG